MPIRMTVYSGETDSITFPLTLNDLPMNMAGVDHVAIVRSGLDGKLKTTVVSGATVTIIDAVNGYVKWDQTASELDSRYGPYRIYFQCYVSGGTKILTVPRGDYYLIDVVDNTL